MKQFDLKETNVTHCTGSLKMKVYNTHEVYCHWHEEYEFLIAQDSTCECIVDTARYTLHKGECLLVHPGELHTVINTGAKIHAIVFHPSVVCGEELCQLLSSKVSFRRVYSIKSENDVKIINVLNEICRVYKSPKIGFELLMKAHITYVIGMLYYNGDYKIIDVKKAQNNAFADVLRFTKEHLSDSSLTLDVIARATNFSRSYISKMFRENTADSFCRYLTALRLSKATEMLRETELSILEISLRCGFQNVSYFIKIFKRQYGVTPYKFKTSR